MDTTTTNIPKFKYKELKVYARKEWLYDNMKKYRQVFDAAKTTFIYTELSIYNLMFQREDCNVTVQFKVFDQSGALLCDNPVSQIIKKDEDIAFIRYSWGKSEPGTYWTKGYYNWQAWIDGVMIGSAPFYTVNEGEVTQAGNNPYFDLTSIKLYEGPGADIPYGQRNYLKTFSSGKTRYLWIEIEGMNLQNNKTPWQGEFFLKIRDITGESIAEIIDFYTYPPTINTVRFTRGWG